MVASDLKHFDLTILWKVSIVGFVAAVQELKMLLMQHSVDYSLRAACGFVLPAEDHKRYITVRRLPQQPYHGAILALMWHHNVNMLQAYQSEDDLSASFHEAQFLLHSQEAFLVSSAGFSLISVVGPVLKSLMPLVS